MKMIIFVLLCLPNFALASEAVVKKFKQVYPQAPQLARCVLCHDQTPRLNAYGLDLQKANLDFKSIEQLDSDGDDVKNIDEIEGTSFPGDKDIVPIVLW